MAQEQRVTPTQLVKPPKIFNKVKQRLSLNKPTHTNWQKLFLQPTPSRTRRSYKARATDCLYAQSIFALSPHFQPFCHHIYNNAGKKLSLNKLLQGKNGLTRWTPALSNEWGCLAQSNNTGVASIDTIEFIDYTFVPDNKKVTYGSFFCDHHSLKDEE